VRLNLRHARSRCVPSGRSRRLGGEDCAPAWLAEVDGLEFNRSKLLRCGGRRRRSEVLLIGVRDAHIAAVSHLTSIY
jgi:hypothetical protein